MGKHTPPTRLETNIFKCKYCIAPAKYITKSGIYICDSSPNKCPVNKSKNKNGTKLTYKNGTRLSGAENYLRLEEDIKEKMKWNKGLTKAQHPSIKKLGETLSANIKSGKTVYTLRGFAIDRSKAFRHITKTTDSYNNICELESSLEVQTATILNDLSINWIRCSTPLILKSTGEQYTPDFYLPDYDIYLDPKGIPHIKNNRYKYLLKQKLKINRLIIEQNYKIFILYANNKHKIEPKHILRIL